MNADLDSEMVVIIIWALLGGGVMLDRGQPLYSAEQRRLAPYFCRKVPDALRWALRHNVARATPDPAGVFVVNVIPAALERFLGEVLGWLWPVNMSDDRRVGIPTAVSAPFLRARIPDNGHPLVWESNPFLTLTYSISALHRDRDPDFWPPPQDHAGGRWTARELRPVRGIPVPPLHPDAPEIANVDSELYDFLSVCDALRMRSRRVRHVASEALSDLVRDVAGRRLSSGSGGVR